jgi:hypothetical protein
MLLVDVIVGFVFIIQWRKKIKGREMIEEENNNYHHHLSVRWLREENNQYQSKKKKLNNKITEKIVWDDE